MRRRFLWNHSVKKPRFDWVVSKGFPKSFRIFLIRRFWTAASSIPGHDRSGSNMNLCSHDLKWTVDFLEAAPVGSINSLFWAWLTLISFLLQQSGLVNEVRKSTIDEEQAQKILVDFMEQNDVEKLASPLGGSTIYMDRIFLQTQLPKVDEHLHYRNIDVSTVKELCKRWSPKTFRLAPKKRLAHRGLDDIKDSIAELKYYRPFMFNDPSKKWTVVNNATAHLS